MDCASEAKIISKIVSSVLNFYYDVKGERVMKRVSDRVGKKIKEIHYIRDEFGRSLLEREILFGDSSPIETITAYIYGPRGLLGFIRENQFYSVLTDHEGSVRLILKGDEIVAGYDYLPYGNLMRIFGNNDPAAHIAYRYTGQECDEEIGLYNYHARFYDPSIGRFYQIDPKEQYFSPYKYAGNSPLIMIDPNGEFSFMFLLPFIIVGAIVGGYLGAAAANKSWDPTKWDWGKKTWLGLLGGAATGALLPIGFAGSVAVIGGAAGAIGITGAASTAVGFVGTTALGIGGAYLGMASANNEWNPGKWDIKSPETWNAGFSGFALASSLPAGVHGGIATYSKLASVWSKVAFIGGSITIGTGSFVMNGVQNNWDFSKPGIYFGTVHAFSDAIYLPLFGRSVFKSLSKSTMNMALAGKTIGLIVPAVVITALGEDFNLSKPSTYFDIIRNMAMFNQHYSMAKSLHQRYQLKKMIKSNKAKNAQTEILSNEIARDAVDRLSKRTEGNLPTAVATATGGDFTVVAFSGKDGDVPVYLYRNPKTAEGSFEFVKESVLTRTVDANGNFIETIHNGEINYSDQVALNSASEWINDLVLDRIDVSNIQKTAHNENVRRNPDIVNKIFEEPLNLHEDSVNAFKDALNQHITENGELTKDVIFSKIREKIIEMNDGIPELPLERTADLDTKYNSEVQKIIDSHGLRKKDRAKQLRATKQILGEFLNENLQRTILETTDQRQLTELLNGKRDEYHLSQRKEALRIQTNEITKELWKRTVTHFESVPPWQPYNCAEPHALTAFARLDQIFGLNERSTIIPEYLGTYQTKNLEYFPACANCRVTTTFVKNVITESWWRGDMVLREAQVNDLTNKIKTIYQTVPHFLSPTINRTKKHDPIRHKRSISNIEQALHLPIKAFNKINSTVSGWLSNKSGNFENKKQEQLSNSGSFQVDTNGTIMLLDLVIRRATGNKFIQKDMGVISQFEAYGNAINITDEFEKLLERVAKNNGISPFSFDIDFSRLQSEISKNFEVNVIFNILISNVQKAFPNSFEKDKFQKFMIEMNKELDLMLNKYRKHAKMHLK